MPSKYVPLPGSEKHVMKGARVVGAVDPSERFEVTVRVRPRNPLPGLADLARTAGQNQHLSHQQYEEKYGANPDDLAKIATFARDHGLAVVETSVPRRSVMLSGTAEAFGKAFGVKLERYEHPGGTYRGRTGPVQVPEEIAPLVEGVFGLDNRPVARPHFRRPATGTHAASVRSFDPPEVAKLYQFPTGVDGQGQCIGIIELGGGYRPTDLQAFFGQQALPLPKVVPVSVGHAHNQPGSEADGEVVLDIEVAGAVAPGATIAVYFAKNDRSAHGFLDAITKAVHDTTNNPAVISISWGGPEEGSTQNFRDGFNGALQAAALLGITVCVAAGDNGAADIGPRVWDGVARVDFPASSPFALACGGTRLLAAGGQIESESCWNQHAVDLSSEAGPEGSFGATGGGVSLFPKPDYQSNVNVPVSVNPGGASGRGVPDVSGNGDPATGYNIVLDGHSSPIGGTSAVAPLWAGLIALLNQKLGKRVGFLNPILYKLPSNSGALRDIRAGDNRVSFGNFHNVGYTAGPGWDACTGLGSPNGAKLLAALATV